VFLQCSFLFSVVTPWNFSRNEQDFMFKCWESTQAQYQRDSTKTKRPGCLSIMAWTLLGCSTVFLFWKAYIQGPSSLFLLLGVQRPLKGRNDDGLWVIENPDCWHSWNNIPESLGIFHFYTKASPKPFYRASNTKGSVNKGLQASPRGHLFLRI